MDTMIVMHGTTQRAVHQHDLTWQIERMDDQDNWQVVKTVDVKPEQHSKMIAQYEADKSRTAIHMGM